MKFPRVSLSGMNRRDALSLAHNLGCAIDYVHASGEVRVSHPLMPKSVTINNRRKDADRWLTCFLTKLLRVLRKQPPTRKAA